jgi:hypothetical protein
MANSYDHIVHLRGIDLTTINSLNDRDSVEELVDKGNFSKVDTIPGISIYINNDEVPNAQGMMIALKNGKMVLKMSTLPSE